MMEKHTIRMYIFRYTVCTMPLQKQPVFQLSLFSTPSSIYQCILQWKSFAKILTVNWKRNIMSTCIRKKKFIIQHMYKKKEKKQQQHQQQIGCTKVSCRLHFLYYLMQFNRNLWFIFCRCLFVNSHINSSRWNDFHSTNFHENCCNSESCYYSIFDRLYIYNLPNLNMFEIVKLCAAVDSKHR